jgi:hypothetical protein
VSATKCYASPGGIDGHTHNVAYIDMLSGNGETGPGGNDGHTHPIVNWTALGNHTHTVSCPYTPGIDGGMGQESC